MSLQAAQPSPAPDAAVPANETPHDAHPSARPAGADAFTRGRIAYWDEVARKDDPGWGRAYHRRLEEVYRWLIPPGSRVLELGCARGDLLAAVQPSAGVGMDFSHEMLARAAARHPSLKFVNADAHHPPDDEPFDFIILSDLLSELWDVQAVLERVRRLCHPRTRIIINTYSRLWDWPLRAAKRLGLARPTLDQNWLTLTDTAGMLRLAGLEPLRSWQEVLWPLATPGIAGLCNKYLVRFWPINHLALSNFIIARPAPTGPPASPRPTVSVVVPARNEACNIRAILERTPEMAGGTELIFVEGHSTDNTYDAIRDELARTGRPRSTLLKQPGKGKGDAVRAGFEHARGDILLILDADLTVPPEDLPRFVAALEDGHAEFVNGVRLVYPMAGRAMRPLNLAGNKFFGWAFTWLLGQPIKDTLCGTKALYTRDYRAIAQDRAAMGDFDPFGDFDLLFGAARLNLKIVDMPVRYGQRTYGSTNIHRFRHGWLLLRMVAFAARRLKFR